jgi:hypothetical protein
MLSCSNLKFYVDFKWCERKLSQPIWSTMWIWSDVGDWCHDQIWGDMWIGTDDNGCCTDQI